MKYFIIAGLLLGIAFGYYLEQGPKAQDYVGHCYQLKETKNAFQASVTIKLDKVRDNGTLNVLIHKTKDPETAEEMIMAAYVQQFNNSYITTEQIQKDMKEVSCD
jgi:hypothetical protein